METENTKARTKNQDFKYDIAISFAEEDRNAALALALALEMQSFEHIYYYPDNREATAGLPLDRTLSAIYSEQARYAIVLLSGSYALKTYTRIELAAILKRMQSAKDRVYLIPVLLDGAGTQAFPELANLGYIPWDYNPKDVAAMMSRMFDRKLPGNAPDRQKQFIIQAIQHVIYQGVSYGANPTNTVNYGK